MSGYRPGSWRGTTQACCVSNGLGRSTCEGNVILVEEGQFGHEGRRQVVPVERPKMKRTRRRALPRAVERGCLPDAEAS